jgi:DNA-directed RNA polymerase specialized sigma24 family protein
VRVEGGTVSAVNQPPLRSRLGGADHEERLARAAASGNPRAFQSLYGRYEERVFGMAFRITGSADLAARATRDAFADVLHATSDVAAQGPRFGASVLLATRNRSVELLEGHEEPAYEPDGEDPLVAEQYAIRQAVLGLEELDREVLAVAGVQGLASAAIPTIIGFDPQAVPGLTARARLNLHDELWGPHPALGSPPSGDCELALPLMSMRDDGTLEDEEDRAWLVDHLAHCGDCRLRLDAMEQAQSTYERWGPAAPPAGLFGETTAAAGRFAEGDEKAPRKAAIAPVVATAGAAATRTLSSARSSTKAGASRVASGMRRRRPWPDRLATAGLILIIVLGLSATLAGATLMLRGNDGSGDTGPQVKEAGRFTAPRTKPVQKPKSTTSARSTKPKKARRVPKKAKLVVVKPVTPKPAPKQPAKRTQPKQVPSAVAVPVPKTTPAKPQPTPTPPPSTTAPTAPAPQFTPCKGAAGNTAPCPG